MLKSTTFVMKKSVFSRRQFIIGSGAVLAGPQIIPSQTAQQTECVFCNIISGKVSAHKLWEDKDFYAFLDHKPINPGHTLLIPKKHAEYIFELEEPLYGRIFKNARKLAKPLREAMRSQRIGVLIEGFGVAHLHIHLVPINKGDGFGKRTGITGVTDEEFMTVADKIRMAIERKK